jgi:rod shape-determining protein MreD
MNLSGPLVLRLAAICFAVVILQFAAVSQLTLFGVAPDVTPLVAMSVGLLCGSVAGAVMGYSLGMLVDLVLLQTLGVSSLLYITIGYFSGRLREVRDPAHGLTPLATGAAASAVAVLGFSVLQFLLGVDGPVSWLLARQIAVTIVVGTLLALPVHLAVRRALLPLLPEDPRRRRRRAYTTGGLSPLSRA